MTQLFEEKAQLIKTLSVCIVPFALILSVADATLMQSADLYATWLAAEFYSGGAVEHIYPSVTPVFDMTPPDAWLPVAEARLSSPDEKLRLFPYIYPPLWAALVAGLTEVMTFATFDTIALVLNQAMMLGIGILALRMCRLTGARLWLGAAMTYAILVLTMPMGIAMGENQPQILVSFLIVAAFERAHFGSQRSAGALLALAAAIKVYPLLFLVIFLARRAWVTSLSFILVGAGLGGLSVLLAGWPLHAEYLHVLSGLSRSVIITNFSFSLDAIIGTFLFSDSAVDVATVGLKEADLGWIVVAKVPTWLAISGILQVSGLALVTYLANRNTTTPFILPFAACLFAFLSPLSWAYTYLTAFVFMAALPTKLGPIGFVPLAAFAIAYHPQVALYTLGTTGLWPSLFWIISIALTVMMIAFFAVAVWRGVKAAS